MVSRTSLLGILVVVGMFITAPVHAAQLHDAAEKGDIEEVSRLIAQGADVNAKDNDGITALYIASETGHAEIVSLLLAARADVNAKHDNGMTTQMAASYRGHSEIVSLLLAAGADVTATFNDGMTAISLAELQGHQEIVEMLRTGGIALPQTLSGQEASLQTLPTYLVNAIQALPDHLQRDASVLEKLLVLSNSAKQGEGRFLAQGWTVRDGLMAQVGIVGYLFDGDAHTYVIGTASAGTAEAEVAQDDFEFARGLGVLFGGQFDLNVQGAVHVCTLQFMNGELVSLDWVS